MQLSMESLKEIGAFTGAPVKKEISWESGGTTYEATIYVKLYSYASAVAELIAAGTNKDATAAKIAACICDAKGTPIMTAEDVTGEADPKRGALDGNLTIALMAAIAEVNNLGNSLS